MEVFRNAALRQCRVKDTGISDYVQSYVQADFASEWLLQHLNHVTLEISPLRLQAQHLQLARILDDFELELEGQDAQAADRVPRIRVHDLG